MTEPSIHPLPLWLESPDEPGDRPRDRALEAWDVHFPILPRREIRDKLLAANITEISLRFYQSQTNHAELFPKMQIESNIRSTHESQIQSRYIHANHPRHVMFLENEPTGRFWDDCMRSHPGLDTQGIWVLDLQANGDFSEVCNKTELSRVLKEIFKYAWQVAETTQDPSNPFWYHHKEQSQGVDSPRLGTMIWHLETDQVSMQNLQECREQDCDLQQSANTDTITLSPESMQYLEAFLEEGHALEYWDMNTWCEIVVRENPVADPQAENLLDRHCLVREIRGSHCLNHSEMEHPRFVQPSSEYSEHILDQEITQALLVVRKTEDGISVHHLSLMQICLADPTECLNLPLPGHSEPSAGFLLGTPLQATQSPGFSPSMDISKTSPETQRILEICQGFQTQIADFLQDYRPDACEEDLQALREFVHPLVPLAWRDSRGYLHANLQRSLNLAPHWSLETLHKQSFQPGILPAILEPQGRVQLAQTILRNILHHLDWPWPVDHRPIAMEPYCSIAKLEKRIPEIAEQLQVALEAYVNAFCEDPELAIIANQDPLLDFAKSAQYLQSHPEQKQTMRNYPILLHIAAEAFANDQELDISLDESQNFRILEKALSKSTNFDGIPLLKWCFLHRKSDKAKIRKILRSIPVLAIQERSAQDPQLPPAWQELCKSFQSHPEILIDSACKIPLEQIPETAAEWCLFQKLCLGNENAGNPDLESCWDSPFCRSRFWKSTLEETRRFFSSPFPEEDSSWQKQGQDLELTLQSAEKLQALIADTESCLQNTLLPTLLSESDYQEFVRLSQKSFQKFQNIHSLNKIRKICTSWAQHEEILKHIRDRAPHWPENLEKSRRSKIKWPAILKHELPSADPRYTVREIHNQHELENHSKKMKNCIWSYVQRCLQIEYPAHILEVRCKETKNPVIALEFRENGENLQFIDAKGYENSALDKDLTALSNHAQTLTLQYFLESYNAAQATKRRRSMQQRYLAMSQKKSTLSQRYWQAMETWKVLRRIYSGLPELLENSEQEILGAAQ